MKRISKQIKEIAGEVYSKNFFEACPFQEDFEEMLGELVTMVEQETQQRVVKYVLEEVIGQDEYLKPYKQGSGMGEAMNEYEKASRNVLKREQRDKLKNYTKKGE